MPYFIELHFSEQHWDTENKSTYEQTYKIRYLYAHPWNCFEDFETYNCAIKHKKHFHSKNPEMPDD